MDSIPKSRPAFVPATTMEEIGVQATKAAGRHQQFRGRDVGWVASAHVLTLGEGESAGAFEEAHDPPGLCV